MKKPSALTVSLDIKIIITIIHFRSYSRLLLYNFFSFKTLHPYSSFVISLFVHFDCNTNRLLFKSIDNKRSIQKHVAINSSIVFLFELYFFQTKEINIINEMNSKGSRDLLHFDSDLRTHAHIEIRSVFQ